MSRSAWSIAAVLLLTLSGCTASDPDEWRLSTVVIQPGSHGDEGAVPASDVFVPVRLADDTAGGFWAVAGGQWLHVDSSGATVSRFRPTFLNEYWRLVDFAVIAPTRVVVSAVWNDGEFFGDILVVHPGENATAEVVLHEEHAIGDLAAVDERVYFIEEDTATTFRIGVLDLASGERSVVTILPGTWQRSAIGVDGTGTLYVASSTTRYLIASDGTTLSAEPQAAAHPEVAVSPGGSVVWVDDRRSGSPAPFRVEGASPEAGRVIEEHLGCDGGTLTVSIASVHTTLGFLCSPHGIAWLSDDEFLVSIGDEGGAPLVRVRPPGR